MQNLCNVKNRNKGIKSIEKLIHYANVHTNLFTTFKIEPPYKKQVVHPRPQTPERRLDSQPGTRLLVILNLVCKFDIKEGHGNSSNPFSKRKSMERNIITKPSSFAYNIRFVYAIVWKFCTEHGWNTIVHYAHFDNDWLIATYVMGKRGLGLRCVSDVYPKLHSP